MSLRPLTTYRNPRPLNCPYFNAKSYQVPHNVPRSYTLHTGTHRASLHSLTTAQRTLTSASLIYRRLLSSRAYCSSLTKVETVTSRALKPCGSTVLGRSLLACLRACSTHSTHRSSTPTTSNMTTSAEVDYRLPTNVKPTHYDLTVRTDILGAKFDGIVTVQSVLHTLIAVLPPRLMFPSAWMSRKIRLRSFSTRPS